MKKTLVDMFVKQQGSYERLMQIAKFNYPDMKPIKFNTVIMQSQDEKENSINVPVLLLEFETNHSLS